MAFPVPESRAVQCGVLTHTYQIVMSLFDAILPIPLLNCSQRLLLGNEDNLVHSAVLDKLEQN